MHLAGLESRLRLVVLQLLMLHLEDLEDLRHLAVQHRLVVLGYLQILADLQHLASQRLPEDQRHLGNRHHLEGQLPDLTCNTEIPC